jgi:hypothetical protein
MFEIDITKKYIIKDNKTEKYFTAGSQSPRLEPIHKRFQVLNDKNGWVTLEQTDTGFHIKWNNFFLDENLKASTETTLLSYEEQGINLILNNGESVSEFELFFEIVPENYVIGMDVGFIRSEEYPDEYTFTINESVEISILGNLLFAGLPVPVTILKRNDIFAVKLDQKYLSLNFPSDNLYENIKTSVYTVNHTTIFGEIVQYTLSDTLLDNGVRESSLFNIIPVNEKDIFRIENFHFTDTYMNVNDTNVFYPSIVADEESEIIFKYDKEETKQIERPEFETEQEKLYNDLGLLLTDIPAYAGQDKEEEPEVKEPEVKEPEIKNEFIILILLAIIIIFLVII